MGNRSLLKWRLANGLTQTAAAETLGISQAHMSQLELRPVAVSVQLALHIEAVTGGAVPVTSWAGAQK